MRHMERDSTLWQIVLIRYPRTAAERKCINERKMMDRLRERYYSELYDRQREITILAELGEAKADH